MSRRDFLFLLALPLTGQIYAPGPQVLTFFSAIDDTDQPYSLYLPKNFDPALTYPLVMSLHGAWSNHRLNLRRVFGKGNLPGETDLEATRYFPNFREVDFIVAAPLARGTLGYQGISEQDVYDVLADVQRRFKIDPNRIYLTGLSMGGGGALWLGLTRPDLWAAIAAVCPAPPPGTSRLAGNALNTPVRLFHGSADPVVSVEVSRGWQKRFSEEGVRVEYIEFPGVRHNSWDAAYRDGAIFDWFAQYRRDPHPARVRLATDGYRYGCAWWVRVDGLTAGELARIDARFTGPNQVEVETSGSLTAFSVTPAGHPRFAAARALQVVIDGAKVTSKPAAVHAFHRRDKGWAPGAEKQPAKAKRPGAEGPIAEAFGARHLYVYGTGGAPSPEELSRRRAVAAAAADWSTSRSRLLLSLPALADKEVRESDLKTSHLILFGTKETNILIARFAPGLPLELNAGAADFGLTYIYPRPDGRYLVVCSGLPWWTGAEYTQRISYSFLPPVTVFHSFPDFVLFKGSLENVLAEGRFDNQWRLPAAEAAKMKSSGAVEIR